MNALGKTRRIKQGEKKRKAIVYFGGKGGAKDLHAAGVRCKREGHQTQEK